ncbi:MAG: biotin synthase BioB [Thermodesulfobacteriota bacterium]
MNSDLLNTPTRKLMALALEEKLAQRQDRFSLCAIMNAKSGRCSEDCSFCTQSAHFQTDTPHYPLVSPQEAVAAARAAKADGASRFSLVTSGRGPRAEEIPALTQLIRAIGQEVDIKVCGSFGIMDQEGLVQLRAAGLSRYHHNLESSKEFFPAICTSHTFEERQATIRAAKGAGLSVCSGGIIGLGESEADRLSLARDLAALGVDSVPLNILMPLAGTPLASQTQLAPGEILRAIAIFRLTLPHVPLRLAAGRDTALPDFLASAFMAGADSMMIGGYLTQRGRSVADDQRFIREIKALWTD